MAVNYIKRGHYLCRTTRYRNIPPLTTTLHPHLAARDAMFLHIPPMLTPLRQRREDFFATRRDVLLILTLPPVAASRYLFLECSSYWGVSSPPS